MTSARHCLRRTQASRIRARNLHRCPPSSTTSVKLKWSPPGVAIDPGLPSAATRYVRATFTHLRSRGYGGSCRLYTAALARSLLLAARECSCSLRATLRLPSVCLSSRPDLRPKSQCCAMRVVPVVGSGLTRAGCAAAVSRGSRVLIHAEVTAHYRPVRARSQAPSITV